MEQPDVPECSFCGRRHGDNGKVMKVFNVDGNATVREGWICGPCVEAHMLILAAMDLEWRDRQIEALKNVELIQKTRDGVPVP